MTDGSEEEGDAGCARPGLRLRATDAPPPPFVPTAVRLVRESKGGMSIDLAEAMGRPAAPHLPGRIVTGLDPGGQYRSAQRLAIFQGPGCGRQRATRVGRMVYWLWLGLGAITLCVLGSR